MNEVQQQTNTKIDVDFDTDPCKCYIKAPPVRSCFPGNFFFEIFVHTIHGMNGIYLYLLTCMNG